MNPLDAVNGLNDFLYDTLNSGVVAKRLAISIILAFLLLLLQRMLIRVLNRQSLSDEVRYRWAKIINYVIALLAFFIIGAIWFQGIGQIAAIMGLAIAGLAIALREPIVNVGGWGYILWRRPFSLGDRVEVERVRGDVADISPFVFSLAEVNIDEGAEQPTGRLVHIPNSYVFNRNVINASQGFEYVWVEIPVVVTFESDWRKAKNILGDILDRHTAAFAAPAEQQFRKATSRFVFDPVTFDPKIFTDVVDIGIELTARYVVGIRRRRIVREAIWEDILTAFAAESDIDFAYPTQRVYFNQKEGKSGAGGPVPTADLPPAAN